MSSQNVTIISSIDDPRIAAYRNLKDRDLARDPDRGAGRFIAEGEYVVRRLLESDYPAESVLVATRRLEEMSAIVPPHVPIFSAEHSVVNQIVGFKFHSGVMAVGRRKPSAKVDDVIGNDRRPLTLVICPNTNNTENLGGIIRIAAGFGVDALILGQHCCDPFFRQSIRVSMGTIFRLPLVQSADIVSDLRRLREEFGVELAATVLEDGAEPLSLAPRGPRLGLLFGNEAQGLEPGHIAACNRRITIPMKLGTDSLNVAVSAGIALYHFTHVRERVP